MERRLAAILVADIAGYSGLIQRDEAGTLATLKGHFSALEPVIGLHGGRVVKTMGDGLLAEFPSVVDAVSAASTMQGRMAERNYEQPEAKRMQFRMGVHVGDVVVDGDDILGDGVNIAARLQTVAEPGGLAVSARVHDDVEGRLDLDFTDLGECELKNIARPIRVYALGANAPVQIKPAPALPDKPSIAVLPFANMSADAEQEYFADGITEDIITGLTYVPWLFVIARNSSFTFKGLSVDVREVGRKLGVRYLLEGSVRRAGNRLRVTGQLIDAGTGGHLWAGRYDGAVEEVFDLQDRITDEVVAAIAPEIRQAEMARAGRKRPDSLDAYDHYLRALAATNRVRIDEAMASLGESIRLAPGYAKARLLRAWSLTISPLVSRPLDFDAVKAAGVEVEDIIDSLETDPEDEAYAGYVLAFSNRDYARGLRLVEQATERCPSFAWAWTSAAALHAYRGNTDKAISHAQQALRLSPSDPMAFRSYMPFCHAYITTGAFENVLSYARKAQELNPRATLFLRMEIVALAHMGRIEEARDVGRRLIAAVPGYRISHHRDVTNRLGVFVAPGLNERIIEGLRLADLPE